MTRHNGRLSADPVPGVDTTRVAALLTCHNRRRQTLAAVGALLHQPGSIDVYLVDDGSTDGTADAVRAAYPATVVLRGDGELYWASGMRRAMAAAMPGDYDHYLWLNDDVILDWDALPRLLSTWSELTQRAVSAVVVGATRSASTGEITYGGRYRPSHWHRSRFQLQLESPEPRPTETMNGNVVLVPRSVVRDIGNLDEYRHSFADQDYGLRAREAGHEVWVAPATVGVCERNPTPTYGGRIGQLSLTRDVRNLFGVKGLLPADWARYSRRWHGPVWPAFFFSPYVRGLVAIARSHAARQLREPVRHIGNLMPSRERIAVDSRSEERKGRAEESTTSLFLVWRRYQGRVDAMQEYFGYRPFYIGWSLSPRSLRPVEYVAKMAQSLIVLWWHRPDEIWLQMPPTPKYYVAALYKRFRPQTRVVADCHNIMLEAPWIRTPGLGRLLTSVSDIVLLHNHRILSRALSAGFPPDRTMLLPTAPAVDDRVDRTDVDAFQHPWALFPASFKEDEPVEELLRAVAAIPELTLVVTGDVRRAATRLEGAGPNVELLGWVSRGQYKRLLASADLILGLTTLDDVQLSVAKEAVGLGRAMVLSDTPLMRELFPNGAVFAKNSAIPLREAIEEALERRSELESQSEALSLALAAEWSDHAADVLARLRTKAPRQRRSRTP